MKKLLLVLLVSGLFFWLSGCSKKDDDNGGDPGDKPVVRSPVDDLAGRLPDGVMGFIASSGGESLKGGFKASLVGQLWDDPEVESFYKQMKGAVAFKIDQGIGEGDGKGVFDKVMNLLEQASQRPFVIGVAGKEAQENPVPVYGFLVVDAGEKKAEMIKAIEAMEALDKDGDIGEVTVGQYTMHGPKETDDVSGYWGWVGQYFVLAINDSAGLAITNLQAGGQVAYTDKLDKVRGHGDAMAIYMDCQKAGALVKKLAPDMGAEEELGRVEKALKELGLGSIKQVTSRMGFSGLDMVAESLVEMPGEKTGLMSCLKPVDVAMMDVVDRRALGAQLCNLDLGGVYDVILRTIMVVGGDEFYQMVAGQIDGVEAQIGAKVRGGLLESLGGPVVFYVMPQGVDGMMTGGFVMVADLKDAALFEKTMKELAAFGLKMSEGMFQDSVVEKEGLKVHSWTIAPLAMAGVLPTWTIAEGKLVFASNSPMCNIAIKQVTAADKGKTSIRSTAAYKKIAEKLPKNLTGLRYSDTAASMRQALALIQQFWPMASGILGNQLGMPMPLKIPEAEGVISKMTPMVGYSWIDETGIHSRSQGPVLIEGTAAIGGGVLGAAFFMMGVRSSQEIMMKSPMDTATKVEIHQLDTAIEMYKLDTGSYPDPEKGLKALFQSEGVKGWKGPYIEGAKIHHDRWGNEYIYRISEKSGKPYILSQGPDGIEGSEDDISNR